jgi:ribonucleoside-triphosphate reductase
MITNIRKRDGRIEKFHPEKITWAIYKAAAACGGNDFDKSEQLCKEVLELAEKQFSGEIPDVESIQDLVEKVLIENGHARTAKAFILYREKRKSARELNAFVGATIEMFSDYLGDKDWNIKENANTQKSVNGLNNYIREAFTKKYWLHEIYPTDVREAHESGDCHIHDLGFFGPYCAGWDLRQLLMDGFGGVPGKVESRPAKHMRAFLGQVVNSTFTTQGETAGAQAWSSFDTYCAPFIHYDQMTYNQVKQCIQEFVFNINVPTRTGFQCPFSNLTFDIKVPGMLKDEPVIIGGKPMDKTYGEFQKEMDLFNMAFCDVMLEGDAKGRVFTFPIPTINITRDFDWNSPVVTHSCRSPASTASRTLPTISIPTCLPRTLSPCAAGSAWMCRNFASAVAACLAATRSPVPSGCSPSTCRASVTFPTA